MLYNQELIQYTVLNIPKLFYANKALGYLLTRHSVDHQVYHRIDRLIWVAVNFWGPPFETTIMMGFAPTHLLVLPTRPLPQLVPDPLLGPWA